MSLHPAHKPISDFGKRYASAKIYTIFYTYKSFSELFVFFRKNTPTNHIANADAPWRVFDRKGNIIRTKIADTALVSALLYQSWTLIIVRGTFLHRP